MSRYELAPVTTSELWSALHDIRRAVLFRPGRHATPIIYNENHPDDRKSGHHPFVLLFDGKPVGTARLDEIGGDRGVVRLVAIAAELQGLGHGRTLGAMIEEEAARLSLKILHVNAAADALGYYEALGWRRDSWDPSELMGIAAACIQMSKNLG